MAPMSTCCEEEATRTPEPLNHVQLISFEPAAPASEPQKKFPELSVFTSQVARGDTRSPPLVTISPFDVERPPKVSPPTKEEVAAPVEVK